MASDAELVEVPPPAYGTSNNSTKAERTSEQDVKSPTKVTKGDVEIVGRKRSMTETVDDDYDLDDEEFEDETLVERLIGLTEMFPESVRHAFTSVFSLTCTGIKSTYSLSRNVSWVIASTATLCFLPLFLELERVQTEEQEAVHQRTMMLGPRAAGGGSGLAGFSAAVPHLTPMESK